MLRLARAVPLLRRAPSAANGPHRVKSALAMTKASADNLIQELAAHHNEAAKREAPWFVANMPESYFRLMSDEAQTRHLRAITALSSLSSVPEVMLKHVPEGDTAGEYTFLADGESHGAAVARQLDNLPTNAKLKRLNLFSSKDDRLSIHCFEVSGAMDEEPRFNSGPNASEEEEEAAQRMAFYSTQLRNGDFGGKDGHAAPSTAVGEADLRQFTSSCRSSYICNGLPRLLHKQMLLYRKVAGTDNLAVDIERIAGRSGTSDVEGNSCLLTMAATGLAPRAALRRILQLISLHDLEMHRANVDLIWGPSRDRHGAGVGSEEEVTMLRAVVRKKRGADGTPAGTLWLRGSARWTNDGGRSSRQACAASRLAKPSQTSRGGGRCSGATRCR
jgi:hypothetical protein